MNEESTNPAAAGFADIIHFACFIVVNTNKQGLPIPPAKSKR